jgi:hypothetical protein
MLVNDDVGANNTIIQDLPERENKNGRQEVNASLAT